MVVGISLVYAHSRVYFYYMHTHVASGFCDCEVSPREPLASSEYAVEGKRISSIC